MAEMPRPSEGKGGGTAGDRARAPQAIPAWEETTGTKRPMTMEEVLRRENLLRAYQRVRSNGGAAGVDGMTHFDETFSEESFGFRPGRSAHQAVKRAQAHITAGCRWVVDLDLEQFFDRVNHDVLMARLAQRIQDKRILRLTRHYLQLSSRRRSDAATNHQRFRARTFECIRERGALGCASGKRRSAASLFRRTERAVGAACDGTV